MAIVLAHGGAGSTRLHSDGPKAACQLGLGELQKGRSVLDAVVTAAAYLEDDPRFNAGTGSNLRLDGHTIEMDASCMTSDGKFGAVAGIREVRNPVKVARLVHDTPHNLLVGDGAIAYARRHGHGPHDPLTPTAVEKYNAVRKLLRLAEAEAREYAWDLTSLAQHWNYGRDLKEVMGGSDTVGAVASDGKLFAAASSTGGTVSTLLGRVGDVPLFGCGIWSGPHGAVAVTGDGDFLTRKLLSFRIYNDMEGGSTPEEAVQNAMRIYPDEVDVGVIAIHKDRFGGGSNRDMAWAMAEGPL